LHANGTPPDAVSVSVIGSGSISNSSGDAVGESLLGLMTPQGNGNAHLVGAKSIASGLLLDTMPHRYPRGTSQLSRFSARITDGLGSIPTKNSRKIVIT
jgi:hypothetical protein